MGLIIFAALPYPSVCHVEERRTSDASEEEHHTEEVRQTTTPDRQLLFQRMARRSKYEFATLQMT